MTGSLAHRSRIVGDMAGAVAVEFALLLPVMLTLLFGSYEISNLLLADMKLAAAAQSAADLVATSPSLAASDFTNVTSAAGQVMTPLPTANQLKIAYASITYSTGAPKIDWHVETNGATPVTMGTIPGGADMTELGGTSYGSEDSVIVVELQYAYAAPISYVLKNSWTLTEAAFVRPRYVACVASYLNTNHICPG